MSPHVAGQIVDRLATFLRERPEVLDAYLFGSVARGTDRHHSDVDVAIYVDRSMQQATPFGYVAELSAQLMSLLGRDDVDVVILNDTSPLLYHRVLRDGLRILARDAMRTTTREGQALSRYCDYVPQLRKIEAAHRARIERGSFGRMSPGQLDPAVVRRHLLALDQALQTLRRHQGRLVEALAQDREELWLVERGLQLCAQNALDVATHLVASAGHDVPQYAAAIDRLADMGIVPADFAARFRAVAGFRNVVVHAYLDVDVSVVHHLLNDGLEDFVEFARHVNAYLTR